jgi:Na+-transporting methylmalonyl-CoA/oxaloacetate decarboxylase gamma subunit
VDTQTLGITLSVLGMGGTLLTLFILSLGISLMKRLFPVEPLPPAPTSSTSKPDAA